MSMPQSSRAGNADGTITSFCECDHAAPVRLRELPSTGAKVTNGYNFADDTSCGFTGTGDHQGVGLDAQLGLLANNGGPTSTLLPATTSHWSTPSPGGA